MNPTAPTNGVVGFLRVTHQNFPTQVGHGHYLRAGIDFTTPVNSAYQDKAKKTPRSCQNTRNSGKMDASRRPSCRMRPHTYWNPPPSTR